MNDWIAVRHFPLDQDLTALVQFLQERGVIHRITEDRGQQLLAVQDSDIIPALNEFLEQYLQGRIQLQATSGHQASSLEADSQEFLRQLQATPIVFVLIGLSILGWFISSTVIGSHWEHWFTFQDYTHNRFVPLDESLACGEIWRLLTPIFLHFGMVHLAFNMILLWWFGQRLELLLGHWCFLLLVAVAGVLANLGQYYWTGMPNFGGISGVIYSFIGVILVLRRLMPHPLIDVPASMLWFMLVWLVVGMTGVVDLFMDGGIANANHATGLIAGAAFALLLYIVKSRR
ncbi:rhomboid family intramembrane serine protease [Cellvibrio japonicus]|uniref:Peptidase, rhomboid family n=1 Tax=Cellvibrio japonicus (strain Ueda107) TaxID=498211 RepID=B3PJ62_CELJU|nr:rhomboid family intramembrane serine protease [Cellvibrio japonicus]ACE85798.1 peptidase, rhomboid family [Cellvibrio japonicus Ueda107]QEI12624.1 rhomboid family intramembrane serine protease [Cellvibrio japonicus]QEI16198.1 rhomboid family intramembrane serine protease [Cellvibrio japonicus]QEI19776.1 rhomboid family intramembrane serine protease [Cellvibrio japonicus]